jgi:hypothetical protein
MIKIATSLIFIILLFLSGKLLESIKRFLKLSAMIILKLLSAIGIKIELTEIRIKTTHEFKKTF